MGLFDRVRQYFRKDKPEPARVPSTAQLLSVVGKLFVDHGIPAKVEGEWLLFEGGKPPMTAAIVGENVHEKNVNVQLDVRVVLLDRRVMIESFSGIGSDRSAAAKNAMEAFIRASFHVMLKALYFPADPHVETKEWMIGGRLRNVVDSEAFIRGSATDGRSSMPCLNAFEDRLATLELAPGLHWVRMYFGQMNGQALGGEVLLDNETWAGPEEEWMALPWPKAAAFYSVRRFLIIQDKST